MFNKYSLIEDLKSEVLRGVLSENITTEDDIQTHIYETADNECIYYSACFDIIRELQITDFQDYINEGCAPNICSIAWYAVRELIYNECYGELVEMLENYQKIEEISEAVKDEVEGLEKGEWFVVDLAEHFRGECDIEDDEVEAEYLDALYDKVAEMCKDEIEGVSVLFSMADELEMMEVYREHEVEGFAPLERFEMLVKVEGEEDEE